MENYILIADSGSTKTDWAIRFPDGTNQCFRSSGINPALMTEQDICELLRREVLPYLPSTSPIAIRYYGAGCIGDKARMMQHNLTTLLGTEEVTVSTDLLAAARALLGKRHGVACILGTGSNCCEYDGHTILRHVSPLGFILGDEGSGAVLGRRLIGDVLKGLMPASLSALFMERYEGATEIIENVYQRPAPNRYLASFVPFLAEHRNEPEIHTLLLEEFDRFFLRNVCQCAHEGDDIHFVGGVARTFKDELSEAASNRGYHVGQVLSAPFERLDNL